MNKINFNGALHGALLGGAQIIAWEFKNSVYTVMVRNNEKYNPFNFTEYETDTEGIFVLTRQCNGSQPTVIKRFREEFNPPPPPKLPKPKLPYLAPGEKLTRKVWEATFGPREEYLKNQKLKDETPGL